MTGGNFGNWERGTTYTLNSVLRGLYNSYKLKPYSNSLASEYHTQYKGQVVNDTTPPGNDFTKPENWAISFFDSTGDKGKLQEMVFIRAQYQ